MFAIDFHNPTRLILKEGCISELGKTIAGYGYKKVLCIFGFKSARENGAWKQITDSLQQNNITWIESWGIQANPVLEKVQEIIELAKKEKTDCIVACGGGSVIDSAKAIAAGIYVDDVWKIYEGKVKILEAMTIFSVLTLSATGSEMNGGSVLTNEKEKKKWAFVHPLTYPAVSFVDPSLQTFLPWYQTANGAIDAMSHIHEYYFSQSDCETTLGINESLLKTLIRITDSLQKDEKNTSLRADFAWAATLALNGISGAGLGYGDWGTHMIEHGISAIYPKVAHGAGLGVVFPAWILHNQHKNPQRFLRWAKEVMGEESVIKGVEKLKNIHKSWKSATTLKELGVDKNKIDEIVKNILMAGNPGGYYPLEKKDIKAILENCK